MLQLISHVIEIQEIGLKKFGTELQRVVGLHQILAGNVITRLEPLLNCQCCFSSDVVSLVPRLRPAFRHLQYGKAGRACGIFSHVSMT